MQRCIRVNQLGLMLLLVAGLVGLAWGSDTGRVAANVSDDLYTGQISMSGPVQLGFSFSPPIVSPGQTAVLAITLTNSSSQPAMPTVEVQLPPGLSLDARALPSATSLNLQTGSLIWQPVVPPNEQRALNANVRVNVADVTHPQRQIQLSLRLNGQESAATVPVWIGLPPQAQISFNPQQVAVGQPVQLVAQTNGPGPFSQLWDLGDGRIVDADNPTVVYALAGEFTVHLRLANPLATVTIPGRLVIVPEPKAAFEPQRPSASVNEPLLFRNLSGGQPPLQYSWDFGDGHGSTERQPTHVYQQPGIYQVRLVIDNSLGQDEISWPVQIGQPPVADMLIAPSGRAGEPVLGQAFGDDSVTDFNWRLGDGRTHTGEFLSHVYQAAGDYWVVMVASNAFGSTEIGRWIRIEPGDSLIYLPLILFEDAAELADFSFDDLDDPDLAAEPLALPEHETLEPLNLPVNSAPAEQLFYYINAARGQNGLPPLTYAHELTVAAQNHAEDMALNRFTGHTGSDGSSPAVRLLRHGYQGGYIGEATAWGMERAIQAVEFWLNSPSHRRILLNQSATEVGVGYTVNFGAPNVWYWTAEFANPSLPPTVELPPPAPAPDPVIQLLNPLPESRFATSLAPLTFSWQWPNGLTSTEQFVVYLIGDDGRPLPIGTVYNPVEGQRFQLVVPGGDLRPGIYVWQVQLQSRADGRSQVVSESRPLHLVRPGEETVAPPPEPAPTLEPAPRLEPAATPAAGPPAAPTPQPTDTP
jgi:PKD repeat protein